MKKTNYRYVQPDKKIRFNDNPVFPDPDIEPFDWEIPVECPPYETIDGYGLAPDDQYFAKFRPRLNKQLKNLQHEQDLTPSQKVDKLLSNPEYYREEINFILREWDRRIDGYWFFNKGKPTYITGDHYFFLVYYPIEGKLPEYRKRDRMDFMFQWMCELDPMCYGDNYPKMRREGATNRRSAKRLNRATSTPYHRSGLQSKNDDHAEEVHRMHILENFKKLPFFFIPVWDGNARNTSSIRMFPPSTAAHPDVNKEALCSLLDYKDSTLNAYDGLKLHYLHNDEIGKCFTINTPILMYDGKTKNVQDIVVGDIVMGHDSTPRFVEKTISGLSDLFQVIPNKGMEWGCNGSHTLTLRSCSNAHVPGTKKNEVLNISVNDYLKLSGVRQKHLMLYRDKCNFKEQEVFDPYLIGLWLGDGHANEPAIGKPDIEIREYIKQVCDSNGWVFRVTEATKNHSCPIYYMGGHNKPNSGFIFYLNKYNLRHNKHIPDVYLYNSEKNRKLLLAGLLDTDGHKAKSGYEIVQKKKVIAEKIHWLAQSLGYYANMVEKIATMKREDGSVYKCLVYRINIFGNDLHTLPLRIARKKMPIHSEHENRRNPLRSGFKIQKKGFGEYFGFTLRDNPLFFLGDFTVAHNCPDTPVSDRWQIQKPCMFENGKIIGKASNTSTVNEMDKKGGAEFKKICDVSHYKMPRGVIGTLKENEIKARNETGETITGLYNHFIPSYEGIPPDFKGNPIDKYGDADHTLTVPYIINTMERFRKTDTEKFIEFCRQCPLKWQDCWRISAKDCNFNLAILEDRIEHFKIKGNPYKVRGNFKWENDVIDSKVVFEPRPDGRFWVSYQFDNPDKESNQKYMDSETWFPMNTHRFVAGGDTFKYLKSKEGRKKDLSNGGGAVFRKRNTTIDPDGKDKKTWDTNRFCCTYSFRPREQDIYGEDMLMMCIYYGCEINAETNVDFLIKHFRTRGYGGFLYYGLTLKGQVKSDPGTNTNVGSKENIYRLTDTYIEKHGENEVHDEYLVQCKDILDDMNPFDLFVACGCCLMAAHEQKFSQGDFISYDISQVFPKIEINPN